MARFLLAIVILSLFPSLAASEPQHLTIAWEENFLTIEGKFPGGEIRILYLEAYCRDGSTDRDWKETVIPHRAKKISATEKKIVLQDSLADGVVVDHVIKAEGDAVSFELKAHNPTETASRAHWAQPCMRVDGFTGCGASDARERVPKYARQCFLFVDGAAVRLPTEPWADKARYVPGQVYCPENVDRNDVNPRPLSKLVPSSGMTGCYSADGKQILAIAWEPCQEIFQGVIACMHSDFRIGGLKPGETKTIQGKLYVVDADLPALMQRYEQDFGKKP